MCLGRSSFRETGLYEDGWSFGNDFFHRGSRQSPNGTFLWLDVRSIRVSLNFSHLRLFRSQFVISKRYFSYVCRIELSARPMDYSAIRLTPCWLGWRTFSKIQARPQSLSLVKRWVCLLNILCWVASIFLRLFSQCKITFQYPHLSELFALPYIRQEIWERELYLVISSIFLRARNIRDYPCMIDRFHQREFWRIQAAKIDLDTCIRALWLLTLFNSWYNKYTWWISLGLHLWN